MKYLFLLSLLVFTSFSAELPQAEISEAQRKLLPANLQRALTLKAEVDQANKGDLGILMKLVEEARQKLSSSDFEGARLEAVQRLKEDREYVLELKSLLDQQTGSDRGSDALRTSMVKFTGIPEKNLTGVAEDAIALLEEPKEKNILYVGLPNELVGNKITVTKAALLYTVVVTADEMNLEGPAGLSKKVQLLYPADLPAFLLEADEIRGLTLFCERKIFFPNAGYIYGGNMAEGVCRGIDCSAFVSYCENHSKRVSTMILAFAARELRNGQESFTPDEMKIREEFIQDYAYDKLIKRYIVPEVKGASDLIPGDIVTWRGKTNHTVFVIRGESPEKFTGIEDTRADDKSKEGIRVGEFSLKLEGSETFVLRSKYYKHLLK